MNTDQETHDPNEIESVHYLVILSDRLLLTVLDSPLTRFEWAGQVFASPVDEEFTGFYDCLWEGEDRIVGLCYFPTDDLAFLGDDMDRFRARLASCGCADLFDGRMISILLDRTSSLETAAPGGEQEFDIMRFYTGDGGDFALSARSSYVTSEDIDRFLTSGIERATIRAIA